MVIAKIEEVRNASNHSEEGKPILGEYPTRLEGKEDDQRESGIPGAPA